MQVLIEKGL